jgi:hypothetical protein
MGIAGRESEANLHDFLSSQERRPFPEEARNVAI